MGVFSDRTSMDRILFAVFKRKPKPGVSIPLLLTQTFWRHLRRLSAWQRLGPL